MFYVNFIEVRVYIGLLWTDLTSEKLLIYWGVLLLAGISVGKINDELCCDGLVVPRGKHLLISLM